MNAEFFLDTNILVYCFSSDEPEKRDRANSLVERALGKANGSISWQVVQEFLNVALRRFERPFSPEQAARYLETTLQPLCRIFPSPDLWHAALRIQMESGYQWYDSLVVAAALQSNAKTLYSEDLQHGRRFDQLTIKNPFRS